MLSPFQLLTLAVLGAYGVYGAGHLEQPQLSSTKQLSKTARLECVVSGVTISTTSVYWYRERPGQAVQLLLYISSDNTVNVESGITPGKFEADKTPDTSTSTLTIHSVNEQDAATYSCALWDAHSSRP
ncbi:T-cell receptor gamma chain V region V108A [Camelus ferus]|nr:T-cell receptor gamma chain V region V108A [Camelus ferus]